MELGILITNIVVLWLALCKPAFCIVILQSPLSCVMFQFSLPGLLMWRTVLHRHAHTLNVTAMHAELVMIVMAHGLAFKAQMQNYVAREAR